MAIPSVQLPDGVRVPAIGQGTWRMGERERHARPEEQALRIGLDLGLTLIDTAEMYGEGRSEELVGRAIANRRHETFLVTKVYPHNASRSGVVAACERSLRRLRTDRLDLYLLHWRGGVPLSETVEAFERLRHAGKIVRWGVSNFGLEDMEEVAALPGGGACATDQVLYNPDYRGIEFDLIPWAQGRQMPLMAYSPVGQGGRLLRAPALDKIARRHGKTTAQIAIAWAVRNGTVIAIPKAASPDHVRENAEAAGIVLTPEDLAEIDAAFPPPARKQALAML